MKLLLLILAVFTVASAVTPSPTSSPTASPTLSPTASPTASPTSSPTASPTASPTSSPTASPTAAPTPDVLDGGEIAAIVIGSIAGVIILGLIIYGIYRQCGITKDTTYARNEYRVQDYKRYQKFARK